MTHRGIEKLCQTQVSYNEVPFIAERICGICGSVHATAYSQAVEIGRPGSRSPAGPNTSGPSCWRSSASTRTCSGWASPAT